jgi:hypothetical protein
MAGGLFGGGTGTEINPYLVEDAQDMYGIRTKLNFHFKQTQNIDMSSYPNWIPIGGQTTRFSGKFDGNNKNITGLNVSTPSTNYASLFGYVDLGRLININLVGAIINGLDYVGSLFGYGQDPTVTNCKTIDCSVTGRYDVGGLIGNLNLGNITHAMSSGTITATAGQNIGGLIGGVTASVTIKKSYSSCTVNGRDMTGGFIGYPNGALVEDCYCTGDVSGRNSVGGFVGQPMGVTTFRRCYAKGQVFGADFVAGFVGWTSSTGIYYEHCYTLSTRITRIVGSISQNFSRFLGGSGTSSGGQTNCFALSTMEYREL